MEHDVNARFERLEKALETAKKEIVEDLTEVMRSMQTELLRGFAAFAESHAAHEEAGSQSSRSR